MITFAESERGTAKGRYKKLTACYLEKNICRQMSILLSTADHIYVL